MGRAWQDPDPLVPGAMVNCSVCHQVFFSFIINTKLCVLYSIAKMTTSECLAEYYYTSFYSFLYSLLNLCYHQSFIFLTICLSVCRHSTLIQS